MSTSWSKVNDKLDLFLDDAERVGAGGTVRKRSYPIPLRIESWNWAQRVLCYHTPRQRSIALGIDTGKRRGILPKDYFAMQGIYDASREQWWRVADLKPGDMQYTSDGLPEYWVWGGELHLEKSVSYASGKLTLYYWAHWPDVEYDTDEDDNVTITKEEICTPDWAELALIHLTTASCLMPMELEASDINQYKIKIESGTPLDNPRAQSADFHLVWWSRILDMFPPARKDIRT